MSLGRRSFITFILALYLIGSIGYRIADHVLATTVRAEQVDLITTGGSTTGSLRSSTGSFLNNDLTLSSTVTISSAGHLKATGTTPGLTSCGSGASITGSDVAGTVVVGGSVSSCTVLFATTYNTTPTCVVNSDGALTLTITKSADSIVVASATLAGSTFDYVCIGH